MHSTETLFIRYVASYLNSAKTDRILRPKGGLDLYRLSLIHKVYRKVVHDEISVRQGSRAVKRIVKEVSQSDNPHDATDWSHRVNLTTGPYYSSPRS